MPRRAEDASLLGNCHSIGMPRKSKRLSSGEENHMLNHRNSSWVPREAGSPLGQNIAMHGSGARSMLGPAPPLLAIEGLAAAALTAAAGTCSHYYQAFAAEAEARAASKLGTRSAGSTSSDAAHFPASSGTAPPSWTPKTHGLLASLTAYRHGTLTLERGQAQSSHARGCTLQTTAAALRGVTVDAAGGAVPSTYGGVY